MKKQDLSQVEQLRAEAEFLRREAERQGEEAMEKRRKRKEIAGETRKAICDFPFSMLWFASMVLVGMLLFDIHITRELPPSMFFLIVWVVSASLAIWRLKRLAEK